MTFLQDGVSGNAVRYVFRAEAGIGSLLPGKNARMLPVISPLMKGDGTIGELIADGGYGCFYPLVCQGRVFAALHYEGTEPECVSFTATFQNGFAL